MSADMKIKTWNRRQSNNCRIFDEIFFETCNKKNKILVKLTGL